MFETYFELNKVQEGTTQEGTPVQLEGIQNEEIEQSPTPQE
jgi:hypothetical protein